MFKWSKDLETGVPFIDAQHKMLLKTINILEEIVEDDGVDTVKMESVISFLIWYSNHHFSTEEECFFKARCPFHELNKRQHQSFIRMVEEAKERFFRLKESGGDLKGFALELKRELSEWLVGHILKVDMRVKDYDVSVCYAGPSRSSG